MFARVFLTLLVAAVAAVVATVLTGHTFTTSAAPAAYAFVDHAVHAFVGGGAFLAVMAAPLAATVPFAVGINEACRLMGISRALVYQLINAGELKVVKIGTRTVIQTDVIQRFLAANAGVPDPNLSPLKRAERKAAAPITSPPPVATRSAKPTASPAANERFPPAAPS
jgi:excisionase family DNA binding protein